MYTVERIEDNIIILEDREINDLIEINKNLLPNDIHEGDILELINDEYVINEEETKRIKENIRNRFNSLID